MKFGRQNWPAGPHRASAVVSELSEAALAEFVRSRAWSMQTMLHDCLLKACGIRGIFIKQRDKQEFDLLWLSEEQDLVQALQFAKDESVCGVVEKGGALFPRYALRFRGTDTLSAFATSQNPAKPATAQTQKKGFQVPKKEVV